ncbi:phosphoenolpyruvate--protein phosphotransferase [soil metagenome]
MTRQLELKGVTASPGYAEGPLFDLDRPLEGRRAKASPDGEAVALADAIAAATQRLSDLAARAPREAAEIVEFQIAMLHDSALTGPAMAWIAGGISADNAWASALDTEIAGYASSANEYFRARAADIRDIRDRVLRALLLDAESVPSHGAILYGDDIAPTQFLETDWTHGGGIALKAGSTASHVAMLARSRGVPMVVGLGSAVKRTACTALLDAEHGTLVFDPSDAGREHFRAAGAVFAERRSRAERFVGQPAVTMLGTSVRVSVNIADPSDVARIDIATCDGVGLMRTEFLFGKAGGLPDEETQYAAYRRVLEWAAGKPVTIRTIDAGGDKPISGLTIEETNPFLGLRGIRLSLARPEIFRVQIRALLRAAVHGNLKVMFPMIAIPSEYERAAALFDEEASALAAAGTAHKLPPLGIMVEVPCVAIAPEEFSQVAFFSIGSNDLTQYVVAAARDNGNVSALNSVRNPAVLKLISQVAAFGAATGISVSLCGDAGGDPTALPALLEAGLRDLSVAPAQLALAKSAIAAAAV